MQNTPYACSVTNRHFGLLINRPSISSVCKATKNCAMSNNFHFLHVMNCQLSYAPSHWTSQVITLFTAFISSGRKKIHSFCLSQVTKRVLESTHPWHNVELNCIFQQQMLMWNTHMQFQIHAYTSRAQQHISTMDGWHWRLTCGFKYVPRIYMNLYNVLKKSLHSSAFPEKIEKIEEKKKRERRGTKH